MNATANRRSGARDTLALCDRAQVRALLERAHTLMLPPSARLVLLALWAHADAGGRAWPSQSTLVRLTGLGESTVRRAVRALAGHLPGFAAAVPGPRERHTKRPTVYVIPLPRRPVTMTPRARPAEVSSPPAPRCHSDTRRNPGEETHRARAPAPALERAPARPLPPALAQLTARAHALAPPGAQARPAGPVNVRPAPAHPELQPHGAIAESPRVVDPMFLMRTRNARNLAPPAALEPPRPKERAAPPIAIRTLLESS